MGLSPPLLHPCAPYIPYYPDLEGQDSPPEQFVGRWFALVSGDSCTGGMITCVRCSSPHPLMDWPKILEESADTLPMLRILIQ